MGQHAHRDEVCIQAHWLENIAAAATLLEATKDPFNLREAAALRKMLASVKPGGATQPTLAREESTAGGDEPSESEIKLASDSPNSPRGTVRAWVMDMKTSAGMEYYVAVGYSSSHGDYMTPNMYPIRGRAEFDVAEWNHLLGHGPEPDILAFDTQ